jgi:SAM-dependent methyltransferase
VNPEEYDRMYRLEDRYWWFVGRRHLAIRLLHRFGSRQTPLVLDFGCGTGVISQNLRAWARPVGLDMSVRALEYCAGRGLEDLLQSRGELLPIQNGTIDGILALDVFEHIEQDRVAMQECFRALKPGGILVLSVPAFRTLWGPHDVALHHFRRYTRPEVDALLRQAGFQPVRVSYSVFFLFPLVWLIRQVERGRQGPAKASLPTVPEWLNRLLIGLQTLEAWLILRLPLPWGSSVVAVARKPLDPTW